ncbi:MAG: hypothetical protein ACRC62_39220, partial [Microcoleus sp.]
MSIQVLAAVPKLSEIIGADTSSGGVSSTELAALKTDVADIKSSLKPLVGQTVYTTATVLNAEIGDEIHISLEGEIQLPTAPNDGADVYLFDELGNIKAGKNNILLGSGDRWRMRDGTFETDPLIFDDDHLRRGWMRFKYTTASKSWWPYVHYGTAGTSSGTGLKPAIVTGDITLTANSFDLIHLKGTGNIQIGDFGNLEYFDVQWDGTHSVTVL